MSINVIDVNLLGVVERECDSISWLHSWVLIWLWHFMVLLSWASGLISWIFIFSCIKTGSNNTYQLSAFWKNLIHSKYYKFFNLFYLSYNRKFYSFISLFNGVLYVQIFSRNFGWKEICFIFFLKKKLVINFLIW